jgi:glycosyltransferase involved in cell wall biosynthesis
VCGPDYEIVLVDDGSSDQTWSIIRDLAATYPNIVGVRLMRNHGHQAAVSAGLAHARGDRLMLIDADLQDPPELLIDMMRAMDQERADVVYGQRTARAGETWFKRASAAAFYRVLSHMAAVPIPPNAGDFRLMSRRVAEILIALPERQRFVRGMVAWIGGRQIPLPYDRKARHAGASKYPLLKMLHFSMDAITSFSTIPLRIATWLGMGTVLIALCLLVISLWRWAGGHTVEGWSSLMICMMFFGSVQLIVTGILGEYVGRLFQEMKQRPVFLIDEIIGEGVADAKKAAVPMNGWQQWAVAMPSPTLQPMLSRPKPFI